MAEQGKITIAVDVDSGQAIKGLQDVQAGLKGMERTSGEAGKQVTDSFEDVDKAAKKAGKGVKKGAGQAEEAIDRLGDEVEETEQKYHELAGLLQTPLQPQIGDFPELELPEDFNLPPITTPTDAPIEETILGLDELKDKTGELDSSLKGLAGAVGVVSPEMEMLLMRTGDLAGGIEAASRLTTLAGGSMKTMMVAGGALGVALGALGGAWMFFNSKVKAADERLAQAHAEMEAGIAAAKSYKQQIQGLENDVGLLADEEFNLIEARRKANEFMQDEIDGNRAARTVTAGLTKDLEKLLEARQEIEFAQANQEKGMIAVEGFRDLGEAIAETNKAYEEGTEIRQDFGTSTEVFTTKQVRSGEALRVVNDEIQKARHAIENYGTQISDTERRTNRLNILFRIQAAQAAEDNVAIRNLALGLATLGDAQATMGMLALRAAKNTAILQAQMLSLGPATGAAIAQIERMFDRLIDKEAPSAFAETFERLKVTVEDDTVAIDDFTTAIDDNVVSMEKQRDVQAEINAEMAAEAEARRAALAVVALEISDRQKIIDGHKQKKEELQKLLQEELISYEEYAAKLTEIDDKKKADLLANDIALAQSRIDVAQDFTNQISALVEARHELKMQKLEEEEAQALAIAGDNEEKQAAIREEFEKKRAEELNKSFKISQATQIATAIMSGASAAIGALAPPPVGLGPNAAGIAMASLVAGTTATQVALISAQKPSFHQGGMIGGQGDQMITAQGGEAVLNKTAVAGLGGESGVDSLNAGRGANGPVVVQLTYKQRVLDELLVDNLAKGGPLRRAINSSSRKAKRGRVGGRL